MHLKSREKLILCWVVTNSVLTFTLPLSLSSLSPLCSLSQHRPPRVVCLCVRVCGGGSNALCETKRSGRMLYDSVISLWVTYTHTRSHTDCVSEGDSTQRQWSPHTHWSKQCICQKRELFHGTHTRAMEASLHALVPDSPIISLHLTVSPQFSLSLCVLPPSLSLVSYFLAPSFYPPYIWLTNN